MTHIAATLNGETVLSTAQTVDIDAREIVVQSDASFGMIHTGRRHTQLSVGVLLGWPRANRALVDAILWHYQFKRLLVFPWRRTPNDDGIRVQYDGGPRIRYAPGGQSANIQVRLRAVRGIDQTSIETLFL